MTSDFSLHYYLPKHLKAELWRIYKQEQREKFLALHGVKAEPINLRQASEITAKELQYLGNTFSKIKPIKQGSKKPRQWVNKFYSKG